jgi:hypothetical protein
MLPVEARRLNSQRGEFLLCVLSDLLCKDPSTAVFFAEDNEGAEIAEWRSEAGDRDVDELS